MSLFYINPIVFLHKTSSGIMLKCNAFAAGYKTLCYYYENDEENIISYGLNAEDVTINDFPNGNGMYTFYLKNEFDDTTSSITFYVDMTETLQETYKKILSYISDPEDEDYIKEIINTIEDASSGLTKTVVDKYIEKQNKQSFEYKSFYQFISMTERYENLLSISCNEKIKGTKVIYGPFYTIFPTPFVSDVIVYKINEKNERIIFKHYENLLEDVKILFSPDQLYAIHLMIGGELAAELIHYQFDEEGAAYFWNTDKGTVDYSDQDILDDVQLSHYGIDVTHENKVRIIDERLQENEDYFVMRPIIERELLNNNTLHIFIQNYDILESIGADFYIAARESDEFNDTSFRQRFLIQDEEVIINTAKSYLDDEIVFNIEDSNHKIVSNFVRYHMNDDISELEATKNLIETYDYSKNLIAVLKNFHDQAKISNLIDTIYQLSHDSDMTVENLYKELIVYIVNSPTLFNLKDNLIYLVLSTWFSRFTVSSSFFSSCPIFYRSRDRFTYPVKNDSYILIDEYYDLGSNEYNYNVLSSSNESSDYNIGQHTVHIIYAIDKKNYKRSGFVLMSRLNGNNFYTNSITIEVRTE